MTTIDATATFERATGTIGAIVHGVDPHRVSSEKLGATLRHALAEYGVLFFHAEPPVSDEEYRGLASLFGEPFSYPYGRRVETSKTVSEVKFEEATSVVAAQTNRWHTDGTPQSSPPLAALLTPSCLPSAGGDTMWASMTAAFDTLSSRVQRLLDGMEAVHSTDMIARHYDPDRRKRIFGDGERSVHPVVPTDPLTGRKFLYVNSGYTECLVGMSDFESTRLLQMLFDHVNTPELHVRLRWHLGTIAVWHERVTQHRAVADFRERRVLRRITIRGEPPQ